jgi:hypothetical protein
VRVRTSTVVNLTLSTLYEVMQWLPSEPRAAMHKRTTGWTLRSAANRPLLRWLEDGPLVVVSDGSGAAPKLKARLMATGQKGPLARAASAFGTVEETPSNSRELLARWILIPIAMRHGIDAGLPPGSWLCRLGAIGGGCRHSSGDDDPEAAAGSAGLDEAAFRTWETMNLGDELEAEVGSTQVLARFADTRPTPCCGAAVCHGGLARRQLDGSLPDGDGMMPVFAECG